MASPPGPKAVSSTMGRVRDYLSTLPSETCARVMEALERGALAGQEIPGADLVMSELTALMAERQLALPRLGNPKRYFFSVLDPFLIDEQLPRARAGRISRVSIDHIWDWLCRDLAPAEMASYQATATAALLEHDIERTRRLAAQLQKALVPVMQQALASGDAVALHRFSVQIGGQAVMDDLRNMLTVIEHRDALKRLADLAGGPSRQLDDQHAAAIAHALAPFARGGAPLMPHAAAVVMWRLAHPWQILRVGVLAAETQEALRLSQSPYGAVLDLMLCDLECLVLRAARERSERRIDRLAATAADFATYVRTIVNQVAMGPDVAWNRQMGVVRARMAEVLRPELEDLPGRVRQILRGPRREVERGGAFDVDELAAIEAGLDLFVVVRGSAAELALNEASLRSVSRLHAFLEGSLTPLLDGLRAAPAAERSFRLQQLDGAVRIARRILGGDYAALVQRAAEVAAAEKPPLDRVG